MTTARRSAATMLLVFAMGTALIAHEMVYAGTVLATESARIHVKAVSPDTKKEGTFWFVVNKDTKVKRGAKTVPYGDAKIDKDERVVIVVNHEAGIENVATEIRLAAK